MNKPLQIFEYERLKKDKIINHFNPTNAIKGDELKNLELKVEKILKQFEQYYDREIDKNKSKEKDEIFSLIKDGVKFKQYVGVVRIGSLTIEILPKLDELNKNSEEDKKLWQSLLYKMVRKATNLDGKLTGFANLSFHANNFISMYIAYFVKEVAYLNRTGLIKKYHRKEGNLTSLKGRLNFSKQISKNLVHAERFYVNYTTYDRDNFLNQILYKALMACRRINTSPDLSGKIEAEILNFPEVSNINVSDATFNKIKYDRKSTEYKNAISLARFILMKLFPALKSGQTDTIAVMYDMNKLYEKYIEVKLRQALGDEYRVTAQDQIDFWKFNTNKSFRKVKPDLVVYKGEEVVTVLDTKWKIPKEEQFPSIQDLRQMFVYNQYYFNQDKNKRAALVYPNIEALIKEGQYNNNSNFGTCDVVYVTMQKTNTIENGNEMKNSEFDIDISKLVEYIKSKKMKNILIIKSEKEIRDELQNAINALQILINAPEYKTEEKNEWESMIENLEEELEELYDGQSFLVDSKDNNKIIFDFWKHFQSNDFHEFEFENEKYLEINYMNDEDELTAVVDYNGNILIEDCNDYNLCPNNRIIGWFVGRHIGIYEKPDEEFAVIVDSGIKARNIQYVEEKKIFLVNESICYDLDLNLIGKMMKDEELEYTDHYTKICDDKNHKGLLFKNSVIIEPQFNSLKFYYDEEFLFVKGIGQDNKYSFFVLKDNDLIKEETYTEDFDLGQYADDFSSQE